MSENEPVTISLGSGADAHFNARDLVRESEELKRRATLVDARKEFELCFANHRTYGERLAALRRTGVCPATDAAAKLDELAQRWFAPEVSAAIHGHIDRLSEGLAAQAASLAAEVAADPDGLSDQTKPTAAVLRERISGLNNRIDDAAAEVRGLFGDLTTAHGHVEKRIVGLERTAQALSASSLDQAGLGLGCVTYCRKVWMSGRSGYLTVAGSKLVFQPVQTTGMLLWKTDHVGNPETLDITSGLSLTELRQPMLGDHGVTLVLEPPAAMSIQLSMGREALDDLVNAAS